MQVIVLFLNQRKKVHLLHQGYGYTLQEMVEKSLDIIRSSVAKYVKYLIPLLSVVDIQKKPRDALKVTRVSIFLNSKLAEGARSGPPTIYPTPPALVGLWHLAVLPNAQSNISRDCVRIVSRRANVIPKIVSMVPNPLNHQMEGKTAAGDKFARRCQQKRSM